MEFRFPDNFLLGVSSAATQIEGGKLNSTWHDWYRRGMIKDGSDPAVTTMHWEKWREDTELMAELGVKICRFGIEWARLIPNEGEVCEEAVAHYREELCYMRELGIKPLLTIHHFTNPMWFERKGAFTKRENLHYYLELVQLTAERFGDLVSEYITINEPNVYATNGYFFGTWPPGHKSFKETVTVMENMSYCHIKAYEMLHSIRHKMGYDDTKVGFANHLRVFDPKDARNPLHCLSARLTELFFQTAVTRAMTLGDFGFPLSNPWKLKRGEYADFHGLNYYSRSTVSGLGDGVRDNCPKNDLGWEIYPEGIVRCAEKLNGLLSRPIWVTENGTCDNDDRFRCLYLADHLGQIAKSSLPFERYYHWCFCDNFEWLEGGSARFGLVHVDYETQKRTIKRSGEFYREMIKCGGMSKELWESYPALQHYDIK